MSNKKNSDNLNNATIVNSSVYIGDNNFKFHEKMKLVFNEKKFKEILDLLDKEFTDKNIYDSSNIRPDEIIRDQVDKNNRHNISEDDYNDLIVDKILPYEKEMNTFFQNSRNKKSIRVYRQILASFNLSLRAYKKDFDNIFHFFTEIYDKMRDRYKEELEDYEDDLIILFLYYTYYICDLDKDKVK